MKTPCLKLRLLWLFGLLFGPLTFLVVVAVLLGVKVINPIENLGSLRLLIIWSFFFAVFINAIISFLHNSNIDLSNQQKHVGKRRYCLQAMNEWTKWNGILIYIFFLRVDKGKKPNSQTDFMIKPEKTTPSLDTSQWPLLLKVKLTMKKFLE